MSSEPTLGEYVLGVEGLALLRLAFTSDADGRAARTAEIRDLLDQLDRGPRLRAPIGTEYSIEGGYQQWAESYDGPLRLFSIEEPPMQALITSIPPGTVLDAACGTGRYSAFLAGQGHNVIGIDQSDAMLTIARQKLPTADFRHGDLTALPLPASSVDAVVCALALVHVPDLSPAVREFARVLRPGGRLVISDVHPCLVSLEGRPSSPLRTPGRDSCVCTAISRPSTSRQRRPPECGSEASRSRHSPRRPWSPPPRTSLPWPTAPPS
jgi:SAM-dependent methyltransferase